MKRVILTGGTGFVGLNLARRLLNDGHELHLLVRPDYTQWRIEPILNDFRLYKVDISDKETVNNIICRVRPDWVFHLAVHGAYSWQTDVRRMVKTNIIGTINLVEACLKTGFDAFVNTGSSSEYGYKDDAPSETELLEPNSHYALTKGAATQFCRYTAQNSGIHMTTLRLYSVYGPYEEPRRLLPTLILRGLKGELPSLVNPDITRDFVYVDDVIEAYLLAATRNNQELGAIYNVGTGVHTTIRKVVNLAQRVLEIKTNAKWGSMEDRMWDTRIWVSDNRKIQSELNWSPQCTFEQGFCQMIKWFRDNNAIRNFYHENIL